MKTIEQLCEEILENLRMGVSDVGVVAKSIADGRVYDLLSPELCNVISWIPFHEDERVLFVGDDCGIITDYISQRVKNIDVICSARILEETCREYNRGKNNIEYFSSMSQLTQGKTYDRIIYRRLHSTLSMTKPEDELDLLCDSVAAQGQLYLLVDNRFGLDYWNGKALPDGAYASLTGDNQFISLKKCLRVLENKGLSYKKYYPYPNAKYTRVLYSESRLPEKGELLTYFADNNDGASFMNFDQKSVFNHLIEEGLFPKFANSYLIVGWKGAESFSEEVDYVKLSVDRDNMYQISTLIKKNENEITVEKHALQSEGETHIQNICVFEKKLAERFGDTDLVIVESKKTEEGVISPFVSGVTLGKVLEDLHDQGDAKRGSELVDTYARYLFSGTEYKYFTPSETFREVFGDVSFDKKLHIAKVSDLDLNFDNIILNDRWNVIDYEWSFNFEIPQEYILYRGLYFWRQNSGGKTLGKDLDFWLDRFGISDEDTKTYMEMEHAFQKYVYGTKTNLGDELQKFNKQIIPVKSIMDMSVVVTVYFDRGEDFNEKDSLRYYWVASQSNEFVQRINIPVGTKRVRIDPGEVPCRIRLGKGFLLDNVESVIMNTELREEEHFWFDGADPMMYFTVDDSLEHFDLVIKEYVSGEAYKDLCNWRDAKRGI